MKAAEFKRAFAIADNPHREEIPLDKLYESLALFDGFALPDFQPVTCRIMDVVALIIWQCAQFNGGWDMAALNEIREAGRKRFLIVD